MHARILVLIALCLGTHGTAHAASFTVNSTTDAVDASPGNGACATSSGVCTLRAAIQETNALAGYDTIVLGSATYTLTRTGINEDASATGDLDILGDLDIKGQGPNATIVDANDLDRIFDCGPSPVKPTVRISGLRVQDGFEFVGGGIQYACDLSLTEVALVDNEAQLGGGIAIQTYWGTAPELTILRSELRANRGYSGGGAWIEDFSAVIRESVFQDNTAQGAGGAIDAFSASIEVRDTLFLENDAALNAGIRGTTMTIAGCTFATHTTSASSGTVNVGFSAEITNSTFIDNWAPLGGAVSLGGSGSALLNNNTFFDNLAFDEANAATTGSALSGPTSGGAVTIGNTLFEHEEPNACGAYVNVVSLGHNRSEDGSCGFGSTGDNQDGAVDLDSELKDNGGPTPTLALLNASYAVDHGHPGTPGTTAGTSELTDQRGVTRPIIGFAEASPARSDIGAFEKCTFGSGIDTDADGLSNPCDPDDDDDGCFDAHDDHPLDGVTTVGRVVDFCGGSGPYVMSEGADPDNDGLSNCEDADDDDDGTLDGPDPCPANAHAATCIIPGKYPCLPSWMACLGGSCVENILRFWEVINPARQLRFERFEIHNETIYMAPLANQTAAQSIAAFASNAPSGTNSLAGATAMMATAAAAPLRLTGRVRIEMWSRATRTSPERRIATVGEYDASRVRLGSLTTGNVIVLEPPADSRGVLATSTTWADGATPAQLPDFDADLFPNAFDNCAFTSNRDQGDTDRDGLGDLCEIPRRLR